ncbi:MAG: methylmalonyl-CoA mutase family protein [Pseudolabrys sp.]
MSEDLSENLSLAAPFPPVTHAQWRALVEAALKGGSFEKRLVSRTYDGLRVEPLYERAASAAVLAGRPAEPWQVIQRVDHPDAKAANAQALQDLENGATGVSLVFAGSAGAHGYGLDGAPETIARALDGVHLDAGIALELDLSRHHLEAASALVALVKARGTDPAATQIRFSFDPLGAMAASGAAPITWAKLAPTFAKRVTDLAALGFKGPFAAADGRCVHAAGGSEAQELAFVIANAVAYWRALTDAGVALDDARRMIFFRLAADADEFLTISKFRALRVGGADSVTALPFTLAIGLPDRFARRIARNTQLILLEESNLYRVTDPAAGSGGIEALTSEIAQAAWTLFQEIEAAGGTGAAIPQGLLQRQVAETRTEREKNIARRKDALTGVSDYPNLSELPVKVLDVARVAAPEEKSTFAPLPAMRLAEPFEALRDKSDEILAKTGARPKVFLANLGRMSDFTVRATFAKNFYEAGGIEAVTNDGFKDQAEMVAAFKASGTRLACLCSSDKIYEAQAADAAKTLAAAGAEVQLAGRPGAHEESWRQAGVKTYIYAGCDALSTLRAAHDILG